MAPRKPPLAAPPLPSMRDWLEIELAGMSPTGRHFLRASNDLAVGFTDERHTAKGNQDRLAIAYSVDPATPGNSWFFAGVCDGVGGESHGDLAASIALCEIISYVCGAEARVSPKARLTQAIVHAHAQVQQRLHKRSATTFAGILASATHGIGFAAVGDSRIYAVTPHENRRLTQDDTLAEMLKRQLPRQSDGTLQQAISSLKPEWQESLGQAIGSDLPLQPQCGDWPWSKEGPGTCVICTDGVWKPLDGVLDRVISASPERNELARRLLNATDQLGGTDNATAIVIPDVGAVQKWLRSAHHPTEAGLVKVVLVGETVVVPASLIALKQEGPQGRQTATVRERVPAAPVAATVKEKKKSRQPPKSTKTESMGGVQLSIVEAPEDDEASAVGEIPKDK
jgi:serine/threonine protein phosphatase PrpC